MRPVIVPVDSGTFIEQRWANGNGRTTELAVDAAHEPWRWRISMAQLTGDAAFSAMSGVRRQFAPLDASMELLFPSTLDPQLIHRLETVHFDGSDAPICRMKDAPGRAINLMLRGDTQGTLLARPLQGHMLLPTRPAVRWFIYLLAGQAELTCGATSGTLHAGSAVWAMPPSGMRTIIEGAGEIALVQLQEPPPIA